MLNVEVRFLAGRYHATPWGRHVNEGDVEWPPSPWRLLRALLATGFSKLGWSTVPRAGATLVGKLAERPPQIWLPPGTQAHTRHFMPPFKGNKDKVLDAFVDVGRGSSAGVSWDVDLSTDELQLLDALLATLSYLGRAESWTEATRTTALPAGLAPCVASQTSPGPGYESVPLLAPLNASDYESWRATRVAAHLESALAIEQAAAMEKGKKVPAKLSAKARGRVEAIYPPGLVDALLADTGALQRAGWSQPPGTQWLAYWRDEMLLAPPPALSTFTRATTPAQPPTWALLALSSDTKHGERLPRIEDALLRMEAFHGALVRRSSDANDGGPPSPCLSGKDANAQRLEGHLHASLIPLCIDSASLRRVDHVLVHAPMGLDDAAIDAIRRVRTAYSRDMRLFVSLVGLGGDDELARAVPELSASRVWTSWTPFVPPRHLKRHGKNTLLGQVLAELECRGLRAELERVEVELIGGRWMNLEALPDGGTRPSTRWRRFRRARLDPDRQPPTMRAFGLRLMFNEPARGPIALGYASHFGLGCFVAERSRAG